MDFDLKLQDVPKSVAQALGIALDAFILMPTRIKKEMLQNKTLEIENELKSLEGLANLADKEFSRKQTEQKAILEARKALFELYLQKLEASREEEKARLGQEIEAQNAFLDAQMKIINIQTLKQEAARRDERAAFDLKTAKDKAELENERLALENQLTFEQDMLNLEKQKIEIGKDRLLLQEIELELNTKRYERCIETAKKMVEVLSPGADQATKVLLASTLLPQLLLLNNVKGLELQARPTINMVENSSEITALPENNANKNDRKETID